MDFEPSAKASYFFYVDAIGVSQHHRLLAQVLLDTLPFMIASSAIYPIMLRNRISKEVPSSPSTTVSTARVPNIHRTRAEHPPHACRTSTARVPNIHRTRAIHEGCARLASHPSHCGSDNRDSAEFTLPIISTLRCLL